MKLSPHPISKDPHQIRTKQFRCVFHSLHFVAYNSDLTSSSSATQDCISPATRPTVYLSIHLSVLSVVGAEGLRKWQGCVSVPIS